MSHTGKHVCSSRINFHYFQLIRAIYSLLLPNIDCVWLLCVRECKLVTLKSDDRYLWNDALLPVRADMCFSILL